MEEERRKRDVVCKSVLGKAVLEGGLGARGAQPILAPFARVLDRFSLNVVKLSEKVDGESKEVQCSRTLVDDLSVEAIEGVGTQVPTRKDRPKFCIPLWSSLDVFQLDAPEH